MTREELFALARSYPTESSAGMVIHGLLAVVDESSTPEERLEALAMLDDADKHDADTPEDRAFHAGRAAGLRMAIAYLK